jgi:hypothetical protein
LFGEVFLFGRGPGGGDPLWWRLWGNTEKASGAVQWRDGVEDLASGPNSGAKRGAEEGGSS